MIITESVSFYRSIVIYIYEYTIIIIIIIRYYIIIILDIYKYIVENVSVGHNERCEEETQITKKKVFIFAKLFVQRLPHADRTRKCAHEMLILLLRTEEGLEQKSQQRSQ